MASISVTMRAKSDDDRLAELAIQYAGSLLMGRSDREAARKELIEFVRSLVAAEREACAKLADDPYQDAVDARGHDEPSAVGRKIAAAIRARGKK